MTDSMEKWQKLLKKYQQNNDRQSPDEACKELNTAICEIKQRTVVLNRRVEELAELLAGVPVTDTDLYNRIHFKMSSIRGEHLGAVEKRIEFEDLLAKYHKHGHEPIPSPSYGHE